MKISGKKHISGAKPVAGKGPVKPTAPADQGAKGEGPAADVELSQSVRDVERLAQTAQALPDVRVEKVDEIKPLVDDGSYHVESEKIAKKAVDTSLRESAMEKRGEGKA